MAFNESRARGCYRRLLEWCFDCCMSRRLLIGWGRIHRCFAVKSYQLAAYVRGWVAFGWLVLVRVAVCETTCVFVNIWFGVDGAICSWGTRLLWNSRPNASPSLMETGALLFPRRFFYAPMNVWLLRRYALNTESTDQRHLPLSRCDNASLTTPTTTRKCLSAQPCWIIIIISYLTC